MNFFVSAPAGYELRIPGFGEEMADWSLISRIVFFSSERHREGGKWAAYSVQRTKT
jgi:hypothetical protein